jgi:hypothetical protein
MNCLKNKNESKIENALTLEIKKKYCKIFEESFFAIT